MKHVFLFDPKAFFNNQWQMDNILDTIGQFFRTQDKVVYSIQYSRYRRNAIYIIREEAEKAEPDEIIRIYAVGGEEILYDCVNGVVHFDNIELVALPYGQFNNFVKIFGANQEEAFKDIPSLARGEPLPTDIINWGVNYALNSCYIGMNTAISKRLIDIKSSLSKNVYMLISKFFSFFSYIFSSFDKNLASRKYKIFIDDKDYSGQYCLIHVANGPYLTGKMTGAKTAVPDDGIMDIALIKSSSPLGILFSMDRYTRGKRPRNGVYVQAKKITIETESQMWIQLDNEYYQDTSINLSLVHNAVQMVAVNNLTYPTFSGSVV